MPPKKNDNNAPLITVIVWVILAVVCIQGYFLVPKMIKSRPVVKPPVMVIPKKKIVPTVPVAPPVKKLPGQGPIVKEAPNGQGARIAIVIDDWGYNRSHCKQLADLPVTVGVAVLPGLPYSRDVIACAEQSGKEPMLHLPIEPHNRRENFLKDYLLTTEMSVPELKKTLLKILTEMPGVVGVNNHTGSLGTEDDALMTVVLAELKRRGLFFLDSFTSDKSVCGQVAAKLHMRIGRRDVFLDNRNERAAIEKEFADAARIAKSRGYVLVIGHDRALSLQIIAEQVKKLQALGYQFISVREYIKTYDYPGN